MTNQHPFTPDDFQNPVYCVGCQMHIPKAMAEEGKGLCTMCRQKLMGFDLSHTPQSQHPQPPPPPPVSTPPPAVQMPRQQTSAAPPAKKRVSPALWIVGIIFVIGLAGAIADPFLEPVVKEQAPAPAPPTAPVKSAAEQLAEKQAAADAAELRAEEAKRGPKPIPSSWDGISPEVNKYLKATLNDYKSMELVECSEIATFGETAWAQRVKYRATNAFGGKILVEQVFIIHNGQVIDIVG